MSLRQFSRSFKPGKLASFWQGNQALAPWLAQQQQPVGADGQHPWPDLPEHFASELAQP